MAATREIVHSVGRLCLSLAPGLPWPVRLPFGAWWLASHDSCGHVILSGSYESSEWQFAARVLRRGMTALDIGAHHGYYTLLFSNRTGAEGGVIAFEPSPRERRKLMRHLRINGCKNVKVEPVALGSTEGEEELFVVESWETGCNSLRPPDVPQPVRRVRVSVTRLDAYVEREKIPHVDFIKLDVEGGELEVLKGAAGVLRSRPRPIILCEVYDLRTRPWGYAAEEIVEYLSAFGYRWFEPKAAGRLQPVPAGRRQFDGNFVSVPEELMAQVEPLTVR